MADLRRAALLAEIRRHFGRPYVWGGKSEATGWDCSGLISDRGRAIGLDFGDPYYTSADGLKAACRPIGTGAAMPGDIVLFSQTYGSTGPFYATHCGVVSGPGQMYDCHTGPGIGATNVTAPYWASHLIGYYRPVAYNDGAAEEDHVKIAELESTLGYLTKDVSAALQSALDSARGAESVEAREEAFNSLEAAIATLRRGG